jgi:hypothetical protein
MAAVALVALPRAAAVRQEMRVKVKVESSARAARLRAEPEPRQEREAPQRAAQRRPAVTGE